MADWLRCRRQDPLSDDVEDAWIGYMPIVKRCRVDGMFEIPQIRLDDTSLWTVIAMLKCLPVITCCLLSYGDRVSSGAREKNHW